MLTIGIDLGTTNSLAAYWSEDGPKIIPNVFGSNLTPSIVSVDENNSILVGEVAKERLITHPQQTASCFKRYMGTDKQYKLGKFTLTPVELSSFVLKSLKADAEAYFGDVVEEAVISVPAYFNDKQRKATKKAGEIAGFKVERIINEPSAAAISYGLHQKDSETKFMVFDLGGGTFDVSILEMYESVMEVRSIAGDCFLGGEDFTNILVADFIEYAKLNLNKLSPKEYSALYKQAEVCKRTISDNNSGRIAFTTDGIKIDKDYDRREYEKLASQLLLRLRNPIERSMRDASLKPDELDAVILIGGATRMPMIKSIVSKMFGKLPYCSINPDETVALGAAVQVALKERNQTLSDIIMTDVCPYSLGTGIVKRTLIDTYESGYFLPIIERNTTVPVSKVDRLCTVCNDQTSIRVEIFQGENRKVEGNLKLGEVNVAVPPAPAGNEQIDVRYTYDINGILEVEVTSVSTGDKKAVVIEQNSGSMSQIEIEERLKALQVIKIHPRDRMVNKLLLAKGERLYEEALGEKREYIGQLLDNYERILASQNELEIKKASKQLREKLENIEGWFDY